MSLSGYLGKGKGVVSGGKANYEAGKTGHFLTDAGTDRHAQNYFVDEKTGNVMGLDNDFSIQQPHTFR